jgi:glycine/D-amino acid oxidase-like deaminating enzyme
VTVRLDTTDVVVVGGGVIGAASAWALTRAGLTVTIVERGGLGQEASGANVGLVTLFSGHSFEEPDPGPVYELTRLSADAYLTLGGEVGVDIEYERCGGVVVAETPEKLAVLQRAYEGYRKRGIPVEWLDADGVRACEPAFHHPGVLAGVFCPLNGHLNPLALTRALALGATRRGARILLGTEVRAIRTSGDRVSAVVTSAGEIPCGGVVNAAGAWARAVGAMTGLALPVEPQRGQVVLTEAVPRFIRRVVSGSEPSARQTRRGNVIIGSTVERVGFDKSVSPATMTHFAHGVLEHYPAVRGLRVIRAWAGLRPATPDHRPIIEMAEVPRGLCLAVGHSRRGICYGAGTGQLVMELLTGRAPSLPLEAFAGARFGAGTATQKGTTTHDDTRAPTSTGSLAR